MTRGLTLKTRLEASTLFVYMNIIEYLTANKWGPSRIINNHLEEGLDMARESTRLIQSVSGWNDHTPLFFADSSQHRSEQKMRSHSPNNFAIARCPSSHGSGMHWRDLDLLHRASLLIQESRASHPREALKEQNVADVLISHRPPSYFLKDWCGTTKQNVS